MLRRILRRAVYFLTQIAPAAETSLLDRVSEAVIERLRRGYPDIGERAEFVMRLLASEEAKFRETLDRGRRRRGRGTSLRPHDRTPARKRRSTTA